MFCVVGVADLTAAEADPVADAIGRLHCYRAAALRGLAATDPDFAFGLPSPPIDAGRSTAHCAEILAWAAGAANDLARTDARLRGIDCDPVPALVPVLDPDASATTALARTHRYLVRALAHARHSLLTPTDMDLTVGVAVGEPPSTGTADPLPSPAPGVWRLEPDLSENWRTIPFPFALPLPVEAVPAFPSLQPWPVVAGGKARWDADELTWSEDATGPRLLRAELIAVEPLRCRLRFDGLVRAWWDGRPLPVDDRGRLVPGVDLAVGGGRHRLVLVADGEGPAGATIRIRAAPAPAALDRLLSRAGIAESGADGEPSVATIADRLLDDIGERSRNCRTIAGTAPPGEAPIWPMRNRCAPPLWTERRLAEVPMDWSPADDGWLSGRDADDGLLSAASLDWSAGWVTEDLYGRTFYSESTEVRVAALFDGDDADGVVLATVLDNQRRRLVRPRLRGRTARLWVSGEPVDTDETVRLLPGRHPVVVLVERPERIPPHLLSRFALDLGFLQQTRSDEYDVDWLRRIEDREPLLRWLRGRVDGARRERIGELLAALAESRIVEGR